MSRFIRNGRGNDGTLAENKPRGTGFVEGLSKGRVVALVMDKHFGFLAPLMSTESKNHSDSNLSKGSDRNVYFRFDHDSTSTGGMVLLKGDIMEYSLASDREKPRAVFAKLTQCNSRSMKELVAYVTSLVDRSREKAGTVLRYITLCPTGFLLVLAQPTPSSELVTLILHLCENLKRCKDAGLYLSRLKQTYKMFCGSQFLTSNNGVRKFVHNDNKEKNRLKELLLQLLECAPAQLQFIMPVLSAIVDLPDGSSDIDELGRSKGFLLKVLHVLGGQGADEDNSGLAWSNLPLLPTRREIGINLKTGTESGLNVGNVVTLPVVRQKGSYGSPENYLDTYFRLLREDCFAGLKKGIQSLRAGTLDSRDMKVWSHISVDGVHFERGSPGVTFAFRLGEPNRKRGPATTLPMGGSLVCLTDDGGHFDSPIWGVVSKCEENPKKKPICFVEIVMNRKFGIGDETRASEATLYGRLMKDSAMVMVESPTYYKAYQPVLESLQHMDPHSIPFQNELVHAQWPYRAPAYLQSPTTILDWSCIFDMNQTHPSAVSGGVGELHALLKRGYKTTLDGSQLEAVNLAVNNRLVVIQGPPGTGKTYMGVRLLQLLMSANTFPPRPVLIITYKNHALDQFLQKCLSFCSEEGSLVRVGGRCENLNLQNSNLQQLVARRDEFSSDRADNSRQLEVLQTEMEKALRRVNDSQLCFNHSTVMSHASDLQLRQFMKGNATQVDVLLSCLPNETDMAELLNTGLPKDASSETVTNFEGLRTLLIKEIRRWIPAREVFKSVQECLSLKKPARNTLIDTLSEAKNAESLSKSKQSPSGIAEEELTDTRQEEDERRSAYEAMRQEIRGEESNSKTTNKETKGSDFQWSRQNFFALPDKEEVDYEKLTFQHLKLDACQFDWLSRENPWDLSPEHRAILAHMLWEKDVDDAMQELATIKTQYDVLVQDMDEINKRRKVAVLQKAKIIGMTTTGAAIQQDVLKFLSPAVILVEEAAEILEPQLLAVLNSDLEHLILIGDHHQLRPSVESYELERRHGFGISMFERLVEHNRLPFQALSLQCRMRNEFVPMLLPIYPTLQSHTALTSGSKNLAPACMTRTFCFWSHHYEETSQRSYLNEGEAQMVVALARWIVSEIEDSTSLTILAAYNGQVTLIRGLLARIPNMEGVEVRTIDRFQGEENQIVIVSLVRSNPGGRIGHLSMRNRLCVAVSRARSGVYLCGDNTTLSRASHWRTLIGFFESKKSLTPCISLCCPRHPQEPPYSLSFLDVANFTPSEVCKKPCKAELDCGHFCSSTCHTGDHCQCKENVPFTVDQCGHTGVKLCHVDAKGILCETKIIFTFEGCGHTTQCECWKTWKTGSLKCQFVCGRFLPGCGHACTLLCSEDCAGAPCKACLIIQEEKAKIQRQLRRELIERKREELAMDIKRLQDLGDEGILVTEVHPDDETAKDFYMAKDRTEKYILPDDKMMPIVTKVEKIENLKLQSRFLEAQRELISPVEASDWLFYGADDTVLDRIATSGFQSAGTKGCSFEVNSTRIAHEFHMKGSNKLLLCEVQLGKTWRITNADTKVDSKGLKKKGYDSLSLGNQNGTRVDKHTLYNCAQAFPRFIVHYELKDLSALAEMNGFESFGAQEARETMGMVRISLTPSPNFKGDCPEEYHFRTAESQFFRMSKNRCYKVSKVEYIYNVALKERYLKKKEEFKKGATPQEERFVFHGTDTAAIASISNEGFKIGGVGVRIKCGAVYGEGVYTALNPDISVAYSKKSNMMLLSLALPGTFNTHHGSGGHDVIVIKNVDQLLPMYVVHYSSVL